ncbi:MAG: FkbM family methyltransferase [Alphaproteobacteria bacterium]|mgnify:CR=1 FL=1
MFKNIFEYYLRQKRHRGKSRIVKAVLSVFPFKTIKSHYGVSLSCNSKDKTNIYAISGDYGYIIYDHIKSLTPDSIFIDIGANYGLYSNLAAKHLYAGKVLSFEPNPYIYFHYLRALEKNNFKNIIPFHCAVGKNNDLLSLSYDKNHSGVSSLEHQYNRESITVPVFNIVQWNLLNFLNEENKIHIKIDVEGYETEIIKVLKTAQWFKNVQSIIIEIDNENLKSFGSSAEELYNILKNSDLKPKIGLDSTKHYDEIFYK